MIGKLTALFPVWAIGLSIVAYFFPEGFTPLKPAIVPLLALIMFCMGMTLTWRHFKDAARQPFIIGIAVCIQFVFMPFFAWMISLALQLDKAQMVGMVLVGSSAGGTASNVICYLARGNVALSILMTMVSTLFAVFLMPGLTYLYLSQSVPVPVGKMMQSIMIIVLIPVISGMTINSLFGSRLKKLMPVFPLLSTLLIIIIIAIIVGLNRNNLQTAGLLIVSAIVIHNLLGLITGYMIPRLLKYDAKTCRTVSIEVGMQNSGLSVALAIQYFSSLAALPGAVFSIWHNLSGSVLAAYWRRAN